MTAPQYINLVNVQFGTEEYMLTLKCHCGQNEQGVDQVHDYGTIIVSKEHAKRLGKLLLDGPQETATPVAPPPSAPAAEPWKPAPVR